MFNRFIVPASLLAALGLGFVGGWTYSWNEISAYKNEIIHLQEFCAEMSLAPTFATVERIVDGDTFKTVGGESVRLLGPDTPEICHADRSGNFDPECEDEPGGQAATNFLKENIEGKEIILIGDEESGDLDFFGRRLRYVYLKDRFINLELVEDGYAPVYDRLKKSSKFYDDFQAAEEEARTAKKGIWENAEN